MRTHKHVKQLKEYYDYDLSHITQKEVEGIVEDLYEAMNINGICPPIFDIVNRLGFSIYKYPFEKEGADVKGFFGIGIDFNINENSCFFLVDRDDPEWSWRMVSAYLLAYYLIHINDPETDYFHYHFSKDDIHNSLEARMALTLLMPEEQFLSQKEFIETSYQVKEMVLTDEQEIEMLADTFRVSKKMVESRMIMLKKQGKI